MGFRFRKTMKIAPGVNLSVGSKSTGLSFGGKGLRYSINSRSGRRLTASIPGTGLSYTTTLNGSKTNSQRSIQQRQMANAELNEYQFLVESLRSIHKESDTEVNWQELCQSQPPYVQGSKGPSEKEAEHILQQYQPGLLDKMLRRTGKKVTELQKAVIEGAEEDQRSYASWQEMTVLAHSVLTGNAEAYLKVLDEMNPYGDLTDYGSEFRFIISRSNITTLIVEYEILIQNVVPKVIKTLTKTGKISLKAMGKTQYNSLVQDYVCSCTLRVARDLFALLPVDHAIIHVGECRINGATGNHELVTLLSVDVDRAILSSLNMSEIVCSDSITNFRYHMDFSVKIGLRPVNKL